MHVVYISGRTETEQLHRKTSCRREAATIFPRPGLQLVTGYTSYTHLEPLRTQCPCWPVSTANQSGPGDLDLWPFELESGVPVACDVGYLCANFGLPRPLCSRLRPDVRDRQTSDRQTDVRQTDVRQHHRLMSRLGGGAGHNNIIWYIFVKSSLQCATEIINLIDWLIQQQSPTTFVFPHKEPGCCVASHREGSVQMLLF